MPRAASSERPDTEAVWLSDKQLEEYKIKMSRSLEGGLAEMCNLSKGVLEKGLKQGMEKGMEKGKLDAYMDAVKKLTASGFEALKAVDTIVPEEYKADVLAELKVDAQGRKL